MASGLGIHFRVPTNMWRKPDEGESNKKHIDRSIAPNGHAVDNDSGIGVHDSVICMYIDKTIEARRLVRVCSWIHSHCSLMPYAKRQ